MDLKNPMTLLAGGTILTTLGVGWRKVVGLYETTKNHVVQKVSLGDNGDLNKIFIGHLVRNYKRSSTAPERVYTTQEYHQKYESMANIVRYNHLFKDGVFWVNRRPLFYSSKDGGTFSFIRKTIDFKQLLIDAEDEFQRLKKEQANAIKEHNNFKIIQIPTTDKNKDASPKYWLEMGYLEVHNATKEDLLFRRKHELEIANMALPGEISEIVEEIKIWKKSRDLYHRLKMPWKYGLLMHGRPGTGKTSLARALACELNIPVFAFSLTELTNDSFRAQWKSMMESAPCIALFEDFDNVFHGRKYVGHQQSMLGAMMGAMQPQDGNGDDKGAAVAAKSPTGHVQFDTILNCIDGVGKEEGILTIITTNDISKIDEAIGLPDPNNGTVSTRPGRMNRAIELGYMSDESKLFLANNILKDFPKSYDEALKEIAKKTPQTPAQFQYICGTMAFKEYWSKQTQQIKEKLHV